MSVSSERLRWLILAGPVSGYSWDLFKQLGKVGNIDVRVVHTAPRPVVPMFAHETFRATGVEALDWSDHSWPETLRFMDVKSAAVILAFSTVSRLPLIVALLRRKVSTPVIFAADTNIEQIMPAHWHGWGRLAAYRLMAPVITEAWTLGRTNDQAFRLLGIRRQRRVPFYPVNFGELGPVRESGRQRALSSDRLKLLTIARLSPEKNLEALIESAASPALGGLVDLTIVGAGPDRALLEARVAAVGATNIRLVGARRHDELASFFAEADVLVLPSIREPWGNVVVEALGLGIPVLATPEVGAAVSLAGHNAGVKLADGSSVSAITAALVDLLDDWPNLASAARREAARIRSTFSVQEVALRMVSTADGLRQDLAERPTRSA